MRSSKSRSRNKSNRNRPSGNIVNRVFDSSGPEGKVRGTPQQIIEKYNQLARDAQLGNDRVAAENFQQHAEHYLRMLAEAQREQQERQDRQQQNQQRREDDRQNDDGQDDASDTESSNEGRQESRRNRKRDGDVIEFETGPENDSGLVETPEERPQRARRSRRKPEAAAGDDQPDVTPPQDAAN